VKGCGEASVWLIWRVMREPTAPVSVKFCSSTLTPAAVGSWLVMVTTPLVPVSPGFRFENVNCGPFAEFVKFGLFIVVRWIGVPKVMVGGGVTSGVTYVVAAVQ